MTQSIPIGTCQTMCPEIEKQFRLQNNLVSRFEKNNLIKSFSRSAAGHNLTKPEILRPGNVLLQTTNYLITLFITEFELTIELYDFIVDRFRSIRQDAVVQRLNCDFISLLGPMIKFFIVSGYIFNNLPNDKFDKVLHEKQLTECFDSFFMLVESGSGEQEIINLYVLHCLSGNAFKYVDKCSGIVCSLWSAWFGKNFYRTLTIAQELPMLWKIAFVENLPIIRLHGLRALTTAYSSSNCSYPLCTLQRILKYDNILQLECDLQTLGIKFTQDSVQFRKGDLIPNIGKLFPTKWSSIDSEFNLKKIFL